MNYKRVYKTLFFRGIGKAYRIDYPFYREHKDKKEEGMSFFPLCYPNFGFLSVVGNFINLTRMMN